MAERFGKSWVLLIDLSRLNHIIDSWHCRTLMEDYTWKTARQYFNCLPKPNVSTTKILIVKIALLSSFLGL